MLSLFTNFTSEFFDLLKHFITFFSSNFLFISTLFLIYVTFVLYYFDRIKTWTNLHSNHAEQSEQSKNYNQNNKFDEKNDFVKKILLSYHEEQIKIIQDVFSNHEITNYLNNTTNQPDNYSETSED